MQMHTGWSAPLTIVLSIAMAASILGWAVVPAVIFAVLLAPLNWMATSQFDKISYVSGPSSCRVWSHRCCCCCAPVNLQ